jgi:hypothetical protein
MYQHNVCLWNDSDKIGCVYVCSGRNLTWTFIYNKMDYISIESDTELWFVSFPFLNLNKIDSNYEKPYFTKWTWVRFCRRHVAHFMTNRIKIILKNLCLHLFSHASCKYLQIKKNEWKSLRLKCLCHRFNIL